MADLIETETQEMTEVEEEMTEEEAETATVDVVDGNTVKLKDMNFVIKLR